VFDSPTRTGGNASSHLKSVIETGQYLDGGFVVLSQKRSKEIFSKLIVVEEPQFKSCGSAFTGLVISSTDS